MTHAPVLFIHAFPLDSRMWRPQLELLRAVGRKLIAPDLRGFGVEPKAGTLPMSIEQHARDLLELLDHQGVPRAVVVGLSMGGYIALALHRIASERVAGLLLSDTKAEPDGEEARRNRDVRIDLVQREGMPPLAEDMLGALVAPDCPTDTKHELRRIMLEQDPLGVVAGLRALRDRPDATNELVRIRVPTSLVCGALDKLTPPEVMRAMATSIPGAQFSLAPGAGHLANLEAEHVFNQALLELLARIDSKAN